MIRCKHEREKNNDNLLFHAHFSAIIEIQYFYLFCIRANFSPAFFLLFQFTQNGLVFRNVKHNEWIIFFSVHISIHTILCLLIHFFDADREIFKYVRYRFVELCFCSENVRILCINIHWFNVTHQVEMNWFENFVAYAGCDCYQNNSSIWWFKFMIHILNRITRGQLQKYFIELDGESGCKIWKKKIQNCLMIDLLIEWAFEFIFNINY